MNQRMRIAVMLLGLFFASSCYTGVIQVKPSAAPYSINYQSTKRAPVLVLPLYEFDGVNGLSYRIEHIREAKDGTPIEFRLPTSSGVEVGHILYGSAATLVGAFVLAPGCRLQWIDSEVLYSESPTIDLMSATEEEWGGVAQLLSVASERFHPRVSLAALKHPHISVDVVFRLTKDERSRIRMVLEQAL